MGDLVSFKLKEQDNNMAEFKTIIGGSTPSGGNWLSELEIGTIFLVKDKTSADFALQRLCVLDKTQKSVMLGIEREPGPRFVDPNRFCQKYMWHETLGTIKDEDGKELGDIPSDLLPSELLPSEPSDKKDIDITSA